MHFNQFLCNSFRVFLSGKGYSFFTIVIIQTDPFPLHRLQILLILDHLAENHRIHNHFSNNNRTSHHSYTLDISATEFQELFAFIGVSGDAGQDTANVLGEEDEDAGYAWDRFN